MGRSLPLSQAAPSLSNPALDPSILILHYCITPNNKNSCPNRAPRWSPLVFPWSCRLGKVRSRWDLCRNSLEQGRGTLESLGLCWVISVPIQNSFCWRGRQGSCWRQREFLGPSLGELQLFYPSPELDNPDIIRNIKGCAFNDRLDLKKNKPKFIRNINAFPSPWAQVSLADWESQGG